MFIFCLYYFIFRVSDVALDREVEGDLLVGDMGQGMPFRPGTFDGCIRWRTNHACCENTRIFSGFILNFFWLSSFLFYVLLYSLSVFLPCSGSVTLTRGHIVHQRDSTPSLVRYTLLWWGFITLVDFTVKMSNILIPYLITEALTNFSFPFVFQSRGSRAVFQLYPENSEQVISVC